MANSSPAVTFCHMKCMFVPYVIAPTKSIISMNNSNRIICVMNTDSTFSSSGD